MERLAVIETEIKATTTVFKEHKEEQRRDFDLVFKKLDALNGKFAGKWVENVSIGFLITIVSGIVIFFLTK